MAERRMFAKTIIDSDAFLDMPLSTQALYFHLSMRADDDGFINNPKKIQRMIGGGDDDLKLLVAKNFLIPFESGVVVIKHWKIHNYIRNDRYKPTVYVEEKAMLEEKNNQAYTLGIPRGIPSDDQMETQVRLGKDRVGEVSIEESMEPPAASPAPAPEPVKPVRHKYGEYGWVRLTDEEHARLLKDLGADELKRCITYVDESAQRSGNKNKWKDWNLVIRKCSREGWGVSRYRAASNTGFETSNPFLEMMQEENRKP